MSESEIMPQEDHINRLPPELLCELFDCMDSEECIKASQVCSRWAEIQARYRPKSLVKEAFHRSSLKPEELLGAEGHSQSIGTFRSVIIDSGRFEKPEDRVKLEKYLSNRELVENWKEIMFYGWNYSFEGDELYLPNVQVIEIRRRIEEALDQIAIPCRIVAPKLRTFCQANDTILEPLIQLNEQIVELKTDFWAKSALLSTVGNLPFTNLRSLALELHHGGNCLHKKDITANFKALLGRLNRLKFGDRNRNLFPVFDIIFEEVKNLQVLDIYAAELNGNDLRRINELTQLKQLTLHYVRINGKAAQIVLSPPRLTKLRIYVVGGVVQLNNVPCLTSLCLYVEKGTDHVSYLRPVAHQLQKLETYRELDEDCFEMIYTLDNLSSLKLGSSMQMSTVEELFQRLKNLRLVVLRHCTLIKTIVVKCNENDTCDCDLCDKDDMFCRLKTIANTLPDRFANFIEMLRSRHVNCTITYDVGKLEVQFQRNSNNSDIIYKKCIDLAFNFD